MIIADSVRRSSTPVRVREPVEGVRAAHAGLDLQQRLLQLLGQERRHQLHLLRDPRHRGVERQAGLDAGDQQIHGVGQGLLDGPLAFLDLPDSQMLGRKKAMRDGDHRHRDAVGESRSASSRWTSICQSSQDDDRRQQQLDAEEDLDRVVGAVAGLDQRLVDARHLLAAGRLHQAGERPQEPREAAAASALALRPR